MVQKVAFEISDNSIQASSSYAGPSVVWTTCTDCAKHILTSQFSLSNCCLYMSCISKTACFSVNCASLSLQSGWNKELKGSNWSRPSELVNQTPPSKSYTAPFWHIKPQPIRGFPAIERITF